MEIVTGVVVGIVVALAGAVGNYFLTKSRDEHHWKREDKIRFHQERLTAYATFLRTVQLGARLPMTTSAPPTPEQQLAGRRAITEGYAETLLLSTPPVRDVAMKLYRAHVRAAGHQLTDPLTAEERKAKPEILVRQYVELFEQEARKELGILELTAPPTQAVYSEDEHPRS